MGLIPDNRRYFRIGAASRIIGVEPYVLRYWEKEFPQIRPRRADSSQRTYRREDLEILFEIKRLLYEEKMTIKGARQRLQQRKKGEKQALSSTHFISVLKDIKAELKGILRDLS